MRAPAAATHDDADVVAPRESLGRLFLRFLRFGFLAWGGPVAQIDMVRKELVEEERWTSPRRFNRVLAIYQVLPGPEAHELCVHFGMLSRGRVGAVLAGLGFMLPGFVLMFALTWLYVTYGMRASWVKPVFAAVQAAVAALIVRAVVRIGKHALTAPVLWAVAGASALSHVAGVHFAIPLALGGLVYVAWRKGARITAGVLVGATLAVAAGWWHFADGQDPREDHAGVPPVTDGAVVPGSGAPSERAADVGTPGLAWSGLKAGLLTFGGAYTVIPFLQEDAVVDGRWMTNGQFLDGLALSGTLPAPLIIFSTFVGYLGGGPLGALVITLAIFLPAFGFTLVFHRHLEAVVERPGVHAFLEGVTAGVVGLVAATTVVLLRSALSDAASIVLFFVAGVTLFRWKSKLSVPVVILGAALVGFALDAV